MPRVGNKTLEDVLELLPENVDRDDFSRRWKLSSLKLPAWAVEINGNVCQGCKPWGGLYLQCGKKLKAGEKFCSDCPMFSEDKPKYGIISERLTVENWTPPDGNCQRPITWMKYLKKNGMTKEDGEFLLNGKKIPDSEWEIPARASKRIPQMGKGKFTTRYLPLDSYYLEKNRVSPSNVDHPHKGKNGVPVRVKVFRDTGLVEKANPSNWTDEAHEQFKAIYGDGFEEPKTRKSKKAKKKEVDEADHDAMVKELQMLRAKFAAESKSVEAVEDTDEEENSPVDLAVQKEIQAETFEAEKKAEEEEAAKKKAKKEALKKKKLAAKMKKAAAKKKAEEEAAAKKKAEEEAAAKKKAEDEAAAKKKADEEAAAKIAAVVNDELSEEDDDSSFESSDDEEEEVEFNAFEHDGVTYHLEDGKLFTEEFEEVGYVDSEGEVHMN